MIIIFLLYFIFILWLFDLSNRNKKSDFDAYENQDIIINHSGDVNDLLVTLDSIKSQSYKLEKINLIIFDFSNEDIKSIIEVYNNIFFKINIIKSNNFNCRDYYIDLDESIISGNQILIIKSGMILSKNLIQQLFHSFFQSDKSILLLPIIYNCVHRKDIFFQLFSSFITSLKFSFINKGIYNELDIYNDCFAIKKESFIEAISHQKKETNFTFQYLLDSNIYIHQERVSKIRPTGITFFYIIYMIINFLFLIVVSRFIISPNINLLFFMLMKVVPEIIYIYSYYNKLKIKFPKMDCMIYLMIIPFYIFILLFNNRELVFNRFRFN